MFSIRYNTRIKSWKIGKNTETITNIEPFVNKCKWKGINFPPEKDEV